MVKLETTKNASAKTDYIHLALNGAIIISFFLFIIQLLSLIICFKISLYSLFTTNIDIDNCNNLFIEFLNYFNPSNDWYGAVIALIATLISIAMPITISNITNCLKPYNDKDIQTMFFEEKSYKNMLWVILFLSFSLIIWFFFRQNIITGYILLIFSLLSIKYFYLFINRAIEYLTATDDVVYKYILTKTNELLEHE